jgi:hypothetical protein
MNLRVRGDEGVAGAIGNVGQLAGNPLMDPRFKIPGGQPWNKTPLLPGKETKEFEKRPLDGPFRVPLAMNGIGNMGGMIAQAYPNATALGGDMRMQPGGAPPGMGEAPNVFSVRPRINYMDPEQGGLELGGAVNIPIGKRGRINVQGGYQPDTTQLNVNATVGQPQGAPGFGVDFFMNRRLRQPSSSPLMNDYGVRGRLGAEF